MTSEDIFGLNLENTKKVDTFMLTEEKRKEKRFLFISGRNIRLDPKKQIPIIN